ncbi:MAG: excinuclease ABC subunit UvrB [Candidatus Fermentibacteraceae bacterium]
MPELFALEAPFEPSGHQPAAIASLVDGLGKNMEWQTLLGVTGSGKTFTMAAVISELKRPTLVISHNKTLAAQLYGELRGFFPKSAVEYFVSYYDYYQPEAYLPASDTYIEKDADLNEELDRLRLKATASLLSRRDVIVVSSVSCIYGLGSPEMFMEKGLRLAVGHSPGRDRVLADLVSMQYRRNDIALARGYFRAMGDTVDLVPSYADRGLRIEFFGDQVESIREVDHLTGHVLGEMQETTVFPAKHFVTGERQLNLAMGRIREELEERLREFSIEGKLLEAQRLKSRTEYDLELLGETGYCPGIENYSRHISGRAPGEPPSCLIDYFPKDMLLFIDESHRTIPQIRGMYLGDRSRKQTLVDHGFRLPSALDNRPLFLEEFLEATGSKVCMSATPAPYEMEKSENIAEQIVRPTGLVDPELVVSPATGQIDHLVERIRSVIEQRGRVLVTTLTKKTAEELAAYLDKLGVAARYVHSEVDALERVSILRDLRLAEFDVLVGVNLLREGLDLPEVTLVAVLDADKEGFLRSRTSLIQTAGRAARNNAGTVILYADRITDSMKAAMEEMDRRRAIQLAYNSLHGITPTTIEKSREEILRTTGIADMIRAVEPGKSTEVKPHDEALTAAELERRMMEAASELQFEKAALLRDRLRKILAKSGG